MTHTYIQNGYPRYQTHTRAKNRAKAAAIPVATRLQVVLAFALGLLVLLAVQPANAVDAGDEQLAYIVAPITKDQVVEFSGVCDSGTTVMRVKNVAQAWQARGIVRIYDADSGQMVRERRLSLANNQTVSYRMVAVQGARYRVEVSLPGGTQTITRTFVDRCPPKARTVRASGR